MYTRWCWMMEKCLDEYLVKEAPSTVYYVPNFITAEEAVTLWKHVYAAPKPKWTQLSNRRLQNWGGVPSEKGLTLFLAAIQWNMQGMMCEPMPKWLNDRCSRIGELEVFGDKTPNHVLINEYTPGQGIMPHEDGPLYHPVVTTISLGSHTCLDFYKPISDTDQQESDASYESRYMFSLLLEPRSLLVLQNDMYTRYLHGIAQREQDSVSDLQKVINSPNLGQPLSFDGEIKRSTRVSLTIRHVLKTFNIKLRL